MYNKHRNSKYARYIIVRLVYNENVIIIPVLQSEIENLDKGLAKDKRVKKRAIVDFLKKFKYFFTFTMCTRCKTFILLHPVDDILDIKM